MLQLLSDGTILKSGGHIIENKKSAIPLFSIGFHHLIDVIERFFRKHVIQTAGI